MESMLNKYDYSVIDSVCYSDNNQESYKKAAEFLGADRPVEDWGGGTGWAKRFFTGSYKNIDGSLHKNVDLQADLSKYTSKVENILLRQVLELNEDWQNILGNAKKSFTSKLCIIVFTPFSDVTGVGETDFVDMDDESKGAMDLYFFKKEDILDFFPANKYKVTDEIIPTEQGYGQDWIIYVEKL